MHGTLADTRGWHIACRIEMSLRIDRLHVIATLSSFALLLVSQLGGWLDPVELPVRDALMRLRAPGLPAEHVVAVLVD